MFAPRFIGHSTLLVVLVTALAVPPVAICAPGSTPTDADVSAPPAVDPGLPLDLGLAYLREHVEDEPAALGFAYMLHRRFGIQDFGDAPSHYDAVLAAPMKKGSAKKGALRLFRRMVDPDQEYDPTDLKDLSTDWDRATVLALYCRQSPLPDDYADTLRREAARGGYHLTHVGMALTWLSDNECPWPVEDEVVDAWIDDLTTLVRETPPGDIPYEAAGVLLYLGHGDRIPEDFWPKLLDEQNEDGGWPFDEQRKESHWHPTLLAVWAILEQFSSTKLDRSVPQPGGPAPPVATPHPGQEQSNQAPPSWDRMLASEERLLALTPDLHALGTALANLVLPGDGARPLFASKVRVIDIDPPSEPERWLSNVDTTKRSFPPTTLASLSREDLALWAPLLEEVDRFEHVGLHMVRGDFVEDDEATFKADVSLDAIARLDDGNRGWVHGRMTIVWIRSDQDWQIAGWRTDALDIVEAPRRFFREVLPEALANPALLRAARHSGHDEVVREFLGSEERKGRDFFPPAMDEHPGLAIVDLDRDGFDDFYVMPHWGKNQMFRNRGDGTFEEIAAEVGLDIDGHTAAAVFADFDNDGDSDAILARTEKPSLYLRNDAGRFHDASDDVDGSLPKLASSVTAVDVNADGLLDVYLSTYAVRRLTKDFFSKESDAKPLLDGFISREASQELRKRLETSAQIYDFPGPPNVVLMNVGEGRLRVDTASPLAVFANTYQSTWADYDDDGDPDVYLANDFAPNHLLRNDGDGKFSDVTNETGTSDVGFGMGATWGDIDGDRREDLYVSNMYSKAGNRITARFGDIDERAPKMARGNTLFRNTADGFQDLATEPGNRRAQKAGWSWGGQFADVDNDAALDLYVLSGYYTAPREFELPVDT